MLFIEWAVANMDGLFLPKREPYYHLDDIIHFFAKRLGMSPSEVLMMDEERRDKIFKVEKLILDKENENASGKTKL